MKWNWDMSKAPKKGQVLLFIGKKLHSAKRDTMMVARYNKKAEKGFDYGQYGPFVWEPSDADGGAVARDIPQAWAVVEPPKKKRKK